MKKTRLSLVESNLTKFCDFRECREKIFLHLKLLTNAKPPYTYKC